MMQDCVIGIDLGTSGCRAVAVNRDGAEIGGAAFRWNEINENGDDPEVWRQSVLLLLQHLGSRLQPTNRVRALAVDGTSSTVLLADPGGKPLSPALMYNDARAVDQLPRILSVAPNDNPVASATSGLAKLMYLIGKTKFRNVRLLHQADWITGCLTGNFGISDEHNCLKLGYDAERRAWPRWLDKLELPDGCLPVVVEPGTRIARITPEIAAITGIAEDAFVVAGTTDSTASVIATGASVPGQAVSVIGSSLVLKMISSRPIFSSQYGVYSHRLHNVWLVGGASNSGGAVLQYFFAPHRIDALSKDINPNRLTDLDYYPLVAPGERFPVNDPEFSPKLTPRPSDDVVFFQALLEGIGGIERMGYARLRKLGAPPLISVTTIGGGAENDGWLKIRQNLLNVPVSRAQRQQAAYGTALLALRAYQAHLQHPGSPLCEDQSAPQ